MILKRKACKVFAVVLSAVILVSGTAGAREEETTTLNEPSSLYARSAVLMDADSGRVLFGKNPEEELPMASTTKIMTCILALENGRLDDQVTVSKDAASQPAVHLGMQEGQTFLLEDLLYSLMLESHNDSAVAIAEHIGGSTEGFADMMNEKAKELGCSGTYFITPNGLDARDETDVHHTTATDLARIMKYCIAESEESSVFLKITGTETHTFADCNGKRQYSCTNHNAFLHMMEGAFTGKTGFTGDAGYCYVGALRQDNRTFIVALLACGWPNNKSYKWSDTRKLMIYGLDYYHYREIIPKEETISIPVEEGVAEGFPGIGTAVTDAVTTAEPFSLLLRDDEEISVRYILPDVVEAPVRKGEQIGMVRYMLNGLTVKEYPVLAGKEVQIRSLSVCFTYIQKIFFLNAN